MSNIKITHTDSNLTTWMELEGNTHGVTSWGVVVDQDGDALGPTQTVLINMYLENNGFTAAAKEFANNQRGVK